MKTIVLIGIVAVIDVALVYVLRRRRKKSFSCSKVMSKNVVLDGNTDLGRSASY